MNVTPSRDANAGSLPVAPEIAVSRVAPVCIHGDEETDRFGRSADGARLGVLTLPGGHPCSGDYAALGKLIVDALGDP